MKRWITASFAVLVASTGCKKKPDEPGTEGSGSAESPRSRGTKASLGGRKGDAPFTPSAQGFKFQN